MWEVAAAASVSVGTVSNVLNAPHKVAPNTVERIRAAIDRPCFVGNDAARQLKTGRSRRIGLLVLDIGNPVLTSIAQPTAALEPRLTIRSSTDLTRESS